MVTTSTRGDRAFAAVNLALCVGILLMIAYPLVYIVSASVSDPLAVLQGRMVGLPVSPSLDAYAKVFSYPRVMTGYRNSLVLVLAGTGINFLMTLLGAYPLSRKDLYGRGVITLIITFTMFFSGGMIPTFLVVQRLGLTDTIWSLILPTAISVYNLIVMRTFFQNTISESLLEAAYIDGAGSLQVLLRVVLPLSKSIIAVICLFYGVDHWNQYFQALLYIGEKDLYPLQLVLREILLLSQVQDLVDMQGFEQQLLQGEGIKFALIIVASVPVLCIYPFVQKHFVKGVMLGSVKG